MTVNDGLILKAEEVRLKRQMSEPSGKHRERNDSCSTGLLKEGFTQGRALVLHEAEVGEGHKGEELARTWRFERALGGSPDKFGWRLSWTHGND